MNASFSGLAQSFVLEGNFVSSNPREPLGPALYHLKSWGNGKFLGGNASMRYKGKHITTGITLRKVQ